MREVSGNWFSGNVSPKLEAFMLAAHKKRQAYEEGREQHRLDHPPVSKAQIARLELRVIENPDHAARQDHEREQVQDHGDPGVSR